MKPYDADTQIRRINGAKVQLEFLHMTRRET